MLLSLDGTLVVQLVNFIIFLVILNVIFLRPVGTAIASRRAYIDKVGADIARQAQLQLHDPSRGTLSRRHEADRA